MGKHNYIGAYSPIGTNDIGAYEEAPPPPASKIPEVGPNRNDIGAWSFGGNSYNTIGAWGYHQPPLSARKPFPVSNDIGAHSYKSSFIGAYGDGRNLFIIIDESISFDTSVDLTRSYIRAVFDTETFNINNTIEQIYQMDGAEFFNFNINSGVSSSKSVITNETIHIIVNKGLSISVLQTLNTEMNFELVGTLDDSVISDLLVNANFGLITDYIGAVSTFSNIINTNEKRVFIITDENRIYLVKSRNQQ